MSTLWLPTVIREANSRHEPASSVVPVLIPMMPAVPSSVLVFSTVPTPVMVARGSATIAATTGSASASCPRWMRSAGVETFDGERPVGSVIRVWLRPFAFNHWFAALTNASIEPYAQMLSESA